MPEATPAAAAPAAVIPPAAAPVALTGITDAAQAAAKAAEGTPSPAAASGGDAAAPAPKEAEAKAAAEKAAADAAKGELDIRLPEGAKVDAANLEAFKALAKAKGFSAEQAQAIADFDLARQAASDKASQDFVAKTNTDWTEKVKADPNYAANQQHVAKFMKAYGTPEVHALLNGNADFPGIHVGSHPALFALFAAAGKALGEDTVAVASGGAKTAGNDPDTFYKNLYPNTPEFHGAR